MIKFTVYGKCQAQGSTRAFIPKGWNRPVITSTNKNLKPWRQEVSICALRAMADHGGELICRPFAVRLCICFYIEKPISVSKSRNLPSVKPDVGKLARSCEDSMTGIVYEDDAQITDLVIAKRYGVPERAEIEVEVVAATEFRPEIAKELPLFAGVGS